jgi:SAM-dependent methyltransferase
MLSDSELEQSEIVANCLMNRQRQLVGSNSYTKELGFNPLDFLLSRIGDIPPVRLCDHNDIAWLDMCCGSGRALIQAAENLQKSQSSQFSSQISIVGVDLVRQFYPHPPDLKCLQLITESVHRFHPSRKFDLITCVHGLHYLGDKLEIIKRAASWLSEDGLFIAHLDLANLCLVEGEAKREKVKPMPIKLLKATGLKYTKINKLIQLENHKELAFSLTYLGADDTVGANYTGQAAVNSFYKLLAPDNFASP